MLVSCLLKCDDHCGDISFSFKLEVTAHHVHIQWKHVSQRGQGFDLRCICFDYPVNFQKNFKNSWGWMIKYLNLVVHVFQRRATSLLVYCHQVKGRSRWQQEMRRFSLLVLESKYCHVLFFQLYSFLYLCQYLFYYHSSYLWWCFTSRLFDLPFKISLCFLIPHLSFSFLFCFL